MFKSRYFVVTSDVVIPIVLIFVVIVSIVLALKSRIFAVAEIVCMTDYTTCEDPAIIAELDKYKGTNLLTLETGQLMTRLTAGDFTIREGNVKKLYPRTIKVELFSVYPSVALQVRDGVEWAVLDEELRFIAVRNEDPNVPVVVVDSLTPVVIGQRVSDENLKKACRLAIELTADLPTVKKLAIAGDVVTLYLGDERTATLSMTKDIQEQISTLQLVMGAPTMIQGVKNVDVRFSQPVLK